MGRLSLVTPPATEPLSLAEAKLHLRVDGTTDDDLITSLIASSRMFCERFTHRSLITTVWDYKFDAFPWYAPIGYTTEAQIGANAISLPQAPLISVTSVSYIDTNGATQVWSSANYTVDAPAGPTASPGRIVPAWSLYYPVTRTVPNAVTVRFTAGYGAASAVPDSIKSAMKLLIGIWYANREAGVLERASADILPFGVEALLWPYKVFA